MDTLETLYRAREILSNPDRWTKGAYARTAGDNETDEPSEAYRYCLVGACAADDHDVYNVERGPVAYYIMKVIQEQFPDKYREGRRTIDDFNDDLETTHDDILMVLDKTILGLEEQA